MTTHYTYLGNTYWGVPFEGFCGSRRGDFTDAAREVTCPECLNQIAEMRLQ